MRKKVKKSFIWVAVLIISALLGLQFLFSYINSQSIDENLMARQVARNVKLNTLDIIRALHLLDLGIRSFALVPSSQIASVYDSALSQIKVLLPTLEQALKGQQFNMTEFYEMRDSVNAYCY